MQNKIINEGFKISKKDVTALLSNPDVLMGWELEFIARPETYFTDRNVLDLDRPISARDISQYFSSIGTIAQYLKTHWLPGYIPTFMQQNPDVKNLFSNAYLSSHPNYRSFYPDDAALKDHIDHLWTNERIRMHWLQQHLSGSVIEVATKALRDDPKELLKYIKASGATPVYGWANEAKTRVYTSQIAVSDDSIKADLQELLGETIHSHQSTRHYFVLKTDATVMADNNAIIANTYGEKAANRGPGQKGYEFTTPARPIKDTISYMEKVFKWMKDKGHYTNESTGFHVGVSIANKNMATDKFDYLKVAVLMGEEHILIDLFDRFDTLPHSQHSSIRGTLLKNYAEPLLPEFKTNLTRNHQEVEDLLKHAPAAEWAGRLRNHLRKTKYNSINLERLSSVSGNPYLEFRMAGNRNYHRDPDAMKKLMIKYGFLVYIGFDPEAFKQEYYKKLRNIMIKAADNISASRTITPKQEYLARQQKQAEIRGKQPEEEDSFKKFIRQYYSAINNKLPDDNPFSRNMREAFSIFETYQTNHDQAALRTGTVAMIKAAIDLITFDVAQTRNNPDNKLVSVSLGVPFFTRIQRYYDISKQALGEAINITSYGRIKRNYTNQAILKEYFGVT